MNEFVDGFALKIRTLPRGINGLQAARIFNVLIGADPPCMTATDFLAPESRRLLALRFSVGA